MSRLKPPLNDPNPLNGLNAKPVLMTQKVGTYGNPFYLEKRPVTTGHLQVTL